MEFKYFQIYREWVNDPGGVVPRLGRELNKCVFTAITISSKETFVKVGQALNVNLITIFENDLSNKARLLEISSEKSLLKSPTEAAERPPPVGEPLPISEIFTQGPWKFEISIDSHYTAIFIFGRFTFGDVRNVKNYTLDKIKKIDQELEIQKLVMQEIDESYLWEFKKYEGDPNSFFE